MDDIAEWRKKIDEIDLELVELLNQRSQCAIEIGKLKHKLNIEIYDPRREEEVIDRVWKEANGPLSKVWQYADAAVVGSAIVGFIEEHRSEADLARKVGEYVRKDLISAP